MGLIGGTVHQVRAPDQFACAIRRDTQPRHQTLSIFGGTSDVLGLVCVPTTPPHPHWAVVVDQETLLVREPDLKYKKNMSLMLFKWGEHTLEKS